MTFKTYLFYLINHKKCFSEIGILKRKHLLLNLKEQVKDFESTKQQMNHITVKLIKNIFIDVKFNLFKML